MCKIVVFAGTTEGYDITGYLVSHGIRVHMCAATDYGSLRFGEREGLTVSHERMDQNRMECFLREEGFTMAVDATHPYATEVTKNIRGACQASRTPYMRVVRGSAGFSAGEDVVLVDTVAAAVDYLEGTQGNILVTTGSKELAEFTRLTDYRERLFARVLSLPSVAEECSRLGLQGKHLICMQGPFSRELNTAMLRQYECSWLVTKETGKNGGFEEKCQAARDAGARLVVIGRPEAEEGVTTWECKRQLAELCRIPLDRKISLVGIGMGSPDNMTVAAARACEQAQCIIGGKRLADAAARRGQAVFYEYRPEKIRELIDTHPEYERIVVALSGDVGFYSGARRLLEVLGEDVEILCGISSLAYFMSRIRLSWEDAALVSAHGRECNLIHYIRSNEKTFAILGTRDGVSDLAGKLLYYGMDQVAMYVGEELSYEDERIRKGLPRDFAGCETSSLSVVCVVNPHAARRPLHLKDSQMIRGKAPMTKEEVRCLSLDKLELPPDAVCYDVGAGTGSVSMEMAMQAYDGKVYAVERKAEAVELIGQNKRALALDNLEIVPGTAPEALQDLPTPSHAFIGGSSGNLREILELLLEKNPGIRMVINCITLETLSEVLSCLKELPLGDADITQVTVAKSRELGAYHLMTGENPIYIISCKGVSR